MGDVSGSVPWDCAERPSRVPLLPVWSRQTVDSSEKQITRNSIKEIEFVVGGKSVILLN